MTVSAIDVDPKKLESAPPPRRTRTSRPSSTSARRSRLEIRAISAARRLARTRGPYAYTIIPEVSADGVGALPVLTTREEIAEAYAFIRGMSDLHEVVGLTEIAGSWYLFQDNITRGWSEGRRRQ